MDKFEVRFSNQDDIWSEWEPVNDPESVAKKVFGVRSRYIKSVRYEYEDGYLEYRRVKDK